MFPKLQFFPLLALGGEDGLGFHGDGSQIVKTSCALR
jgi:hypothetical protein